MMDVCKVKKLVVIGQTGKHTYFCSFLDECISVSTQNEDQISHQDCELVT